MCTSNEYTYVYPDGRRQAPQRQHMLCPSSRHGVPCPDTVVYSYPPKTIPFPGQQMASSSAPATSSPYLSPSHFPPTPTYTPRASTPNYRSGDESDRSAGYHSGSSRSRNSGGAGNKHAPTVYINGKKVYDSSSPSRGSERFVVVDGPPSPRTPSSSSRATPSSPSSPYMVPTSSRRRESSSSSRRPVIVEDPRRVEIELVDADGRRHHRKEHRRHPSSSSYHSYDSDDTRRRHHRVDSDKEQRRQTARQSFLQDRIAQANAEIAGRSKVPQRSSTMNFSREREAELVDAVRRMDVKDEWQRQQDAEDEAQRRRLKERMGMPRRSATVGHGSRRPRVYYEDASY